MASIPAFGPDGLLPAGDYEVSFDELRQSILALGPDDAATQTCWDTPWREQLVKNLEILTRQLWQAGIREVFADGSFAEDKDHPNDIDGYFVCDLTQLKGGELARQVNLLDPFKVWTWDPATRRPHRGDPKSSFRVASLPGGTLSPRTWFGHRLWYPRQVLSRARISVGVSPVSP